MYACILGTGRGFFEGCAPPAMQPPIPATHPQHEIAGALAIGLRPEGDHAPLYCGRCFSSG